MERAKWTVPLLVAATRPQLWRQHITNRPDRTYDIVGSSNTAGERPNHRGVCRTRGRSDDEREGL